MVTSGLNEADRVLTELARALMRSGDAQLYELGRRFRVQAPYSVRLRCAAIGDGLSERVIEVRADSEDEAIANARMAAARAARMAPTGVFDLDGIEVIECRPGWARESAALA